MPTTAAAAPGVHPDLAAQMALYAEHAHNHDAGAHPHGALLYGFELHPHRGRGRLRPRGYAERRTPGRRGGRGLPRDHGPADRGGDRHPFPRRPRQRHLQLRFRRGRTGGQGRGHRPGRTDRQPVARRRHSGAHPASPRPLSIRRASGIRRDWQLRQRHPRTAATRQGRVREPDPNLRGQARNRDCGRPAASRACAQRNGRSKCRLAARRKGSDLRRRHPGHDLPQRLCALPRHASTATPCNGRRASTGCASSRRRF